MRILITLSVSLLALSLNSCSKEDGIDGHDKNLITDPPGVFVSAPSGASIKKVGDNYLWLGDILLSPMQLEEVKSKGYIPGIKEMHESGKPDLSLSPVTNLPLSLNNSSKAVGVYPTPYNLWAMVRYVYAPDLSYDRRQIIKEAILHWEANTNIRFYNATGQPTKDPQYGFDYPYVEFVNGNVNNSYVGRIGGRQVINLAQYQTSRASIHEIGHAIGLFHEQNAVNRDNFININWSNIKQSAKSNFDRVTSNYHIIGAVDYNSVMMYSSYIGDPDMVFDTNQPVMTRKDGTTWVGQSTLSSADRMWANGLYLPYIARSDVYRELADVVYKSDNTVMTPQERLSLQAQLNNGNPTPPPGGRIPNNP